MAAGVLDLLIEQGSTFSRTIRLQDSQGAALNLTGFIARGAIKTDALALLPLATFTMTIPAPTTGTIVATISATDTAAIPTTGTRFDKTSKYTYDMEIESLGIVTRILNGTVTVSPEVTK